MQQRKRHKGKGEKRNRDHKLVSWIGTAPSMTRGNWEEGYSWVMTYDD